MTDIVQLSENIQAALAERDRKRRNPFSRTTNMTIDTQFIATVTRLAHDYAQAEARKETR